MLLGRSGSPWPEYLPLHNTQIRREKWKIELSNMAKEDKQYKQDKPDTLDKSDKDFVVVDIDGSAPVAHL